MNNEITSILISGTTFNKEDQEFLDYIGVVYNGKIIVTDCTFNNISFIGGFKSVTRCTFKYNSVDEPTILDSVGIFPLGINPDVNIDFDFDDPAEWWKKS